MGKQGLIALALLTAACGSSAPTGEGLTPPEPKPASDWYGDSATRVISLEQGWTPQQSEWFYFTTQGSELMPYAFFVALEQADNTELFRDGHNMRRLRYLSDVASSDNPDNLPVGFVRNKDSIGFTCAACHTTQWNYNGTGIRIDGGPTMANFSGFLDDLIASMKATIDDDAKFERFAGRVLTDTPTDAAKAALREQLMDVYQTRVTARRVNHSDTAYGFARLDAFGRIFNRALTLADPNNGNPASAPVSYPFLWDTSQHDYVQWNGLAANANLGVLQRNIGEVIGVFGDITLETGLLPKSYPSSVVVGNLIKIEELMWLLQSPVWPESVLPELDDHLVEQGKAIYAAECAQCHHDINRADPKRKVHAQMYGLDIIKTDPAMAQNIVDAKGASGVLEGRKLLIVSGDKFGAETTAIEVVTNIVAGILEHNLKGDAKSEIVAIREREGGKAPPKQGEFDEAQPLLAYKARPLNGIWATAPFLHNGSVPTLYDLLLPVAKRPKTFWVGRRELDVKKVGITTAKFDGGFELDTSLPGNSNAGHEYGAELSEADRWALVEYLKSL